MSLGKERAKMAVGIAVGDNKKAYPGNLTPFVTVTCIVAAMGGLIFGYDIGISGNSSWIKFDALNLDFVTPLIVFPL